MKANNRLIPGNKKSIKTTMKRYLFVKKQLQKIISQIEDIEDETSTDTLPHVHYYKKHKTHNFPRFETL